MTKKLPKTTVVTIDKFGRLLIPKRLRNLLGLEAGSKVELSAFEEGQRLQIKPKQQQRHTISHTATGWPFVVTTPASTIVETFSLTDFIAESRNIRDAKFNATNG